MNDAPMQIGTRCDCNVNDHHKWDSAFKVWVIEAPGGKWYRSCDAHLSYLLHLEGRNVVTYQLESDLGDWGV